MESLTIREILDEVYRGQVRIPAFQRGFVWEPDMVAFLMDSIFKEYPFGSLLFWRTKEQLRTEQNLGPFELPKPKDDYPLDYVLDGQQRITSIFGVFQNELKAPATDSWNDIYFDYSVEGDVQETQFFALPDDEVDPRKHFPLRAIFNTAEYRRLTRDMDDALAKTIDDMQSVFKEVRIPVQIFKTEEKPIVAIIFERINRQGVPLDTLQLLSAWTWSEEFQLQEQFDDLISELQNYGFSELSNDINLLLRCTAAVLTHSASPGSLAELNGAIVRERFDEVLNGIRGALDHLKAELQVHSISHLPYLNYLVPLSVFFAVPDDQEVAMTNEQRETINKWFWRAGFSKRYSSGLLRNLNTDIVEMINLKEGKESSLGNIPVTISPEFFKESKFLISSVNSKLFTTLLAQNRPLNFISGTPVDLSAKLRRYNRKEFHHLMPRAFLRGTKQVEYHESCLANFCFISRADNRGVGGDAPSVYKAKMGGNIDETLKSHLCPMSLFDDKFGLFIDARSEMLADYAKELCSID